VTRVLGFAITAIRNLIEEELEPTAQLPNEQELVKITDVSRAMMREAIARLETDAVVTKVC